MRAAIVAAALLALAGCASRAPAPPCEQVSYNRREIPPGPGMLTGPRGTWTVTRHGSEDESAGVQSTAGDRPGLASISELCRSDHAFVLIGAAAAIDNKACLLATAPGEVVC